jgi:HEPN domain-containing protein
MGLYPQEWFKQADYDMETADFMFNGGRYFYVVFMCHLSIEKALKGLYSQKLNEVPPKVHNLLYLVEKMGLNLPDDLYKTVSILNDLSVPTRYPDDLEKMFKNYSKERTEELLKRCKEVLTWLKTTFMP